MYRIEKKERFFEVFEFFINVKPKLGFIVDVGLHRVLLLHLRQFCIGMGTQNFFFLLIHLQNGRPLNMNKLSYFFITPTSFIKIRFNLTYLPAVCSVNIIQSSK